MGASSGFNVFHFVLLCCGLNDVIYLGQIVTLEEEYLLFGVLGLGASLLLLSEEKLEWG